MNQMKETDTLFFELIRVATGTQDSLSRLPSAKEWGKLYKMAEKQSLLGICLAGLQNLGGDADDGFLSIGMNEMQYLTWMGMAATIQMKYDQHRKFIARLAGFYEGEGIGMMLLKGYGLSLYYPCPQLRTPGDVDIFLFNRDGSDAPAWRRGDEAIEREFKVAVRNDCEHHTKFELDGISVENHYDFVNTRIRRSSKRLERTFKALAQDRGKSVEVEGRTVFLPSDRLNSLFLLRHCSGHFASEGISLKNVLDWGMFVCHSDGIDWQWLWGEAERYNMHRFLMSLNAICVEDLGMPADKFVQKHCDSALKARVLGEIMQGPDLVKDASAWLRTKRWWQHRWKHRICYDDSMLSSFIYSVKANVESGLK